MRKKQTVEKTKNYSDPFKLNYKKKTTVTRNIDMRKQEKHFSSIYKGERKVAESIVLDTSQKDNEGQELIYKECQEIIRIIIRSKASGTNDINNELTKHGGDILMERLYELILKIQREETMPLQWKKVFQYQNQKKETKQYGNTTHCI